MSKQRPFIVFTAEDFKELMGPGQGGPAIDTWCTFTSLTADLLAQQANRILNERGTRVGKIDVVLQGPISATVWSHNLDQTHFTHEALLVSPRPIGEGQREIEK